MRRKKDTIKGLKISQIRPNSDLSGRCIQQSLKITMTN